MSPAAAVVDAVAEEEAEVLAAAFCASRTVMLLQVSHARSFPTHRRCVFVGDAQGQMVSPR